MFEFRVERMSCGGCANSVKRSVQAVDSNAKVDVDLVHKKVCIETTADVDRIKSAVVDAGYPVTSSKVV